MSANRLESADGSAEPRERIATWGLSACTRVAGALTRMPATAVVLVLLVISGAILRWVVTDQEAVEQWASTNLINLDHHPLTALVASAFVSPDGLGMDFLLLAVACAVLELRIGARRLLAVIAAGHVLATILTEGAVGMAILTGHEAVGAARQLDVGISYAAWTAVGAALLFAPGRWRRGAVTVAALYLSTRLGLTWDMTTWGHLLSWLIGVLSWPLLLRNPTEDRRKVRG